MTERESKKNWKGRERAREDRVRRREIARGMDRANVLRATRRGVEAADRSSSTSTKATKQQQKLDLNFLKCATTHYVRQYTAAVTWLLKFNNGLKQFQDILEDPALLRISPGKKN